mgnify:CR=1 FL=1
MRPAIQVDDADYGGKEGTYLYCISQLMQSVSEGNPHKKRKTPSQAIGLRVSPQARSLVLLISGILATKRRLGVVYETLLQTHLKINLLLIFPRQLQWVYNSLT